MRKPLQTSGGKRFIDGFTDDVRLAGPNHLATPSVNVDITKTGEAVSRKGIIATSIDLLQDGKTSRPFHVSRYNVTFFAVNGKVLFVNHNNNDAVVDTGLSLTETNGRKTRFGEYAGDIYLTNRTDGLRQIHMARANGTASAGAGTITVDQDLAGRLTTFSDVTGSLRIANSTPFAESYTAVSAAGVITLTNTLDAAVADDTIVYTVKDISSGKPKGSGLTFWKERMIVWGVTSDTAVNTATNLVYMSSFAIISGGDGTALSNIIDFVTTNTAAREMLGKGGIVTNCLATRDYLYMFTEEAAYYSGVADVNQTTGGTLPQLLSNQYGCINEDCAADLGNGTCVFMANNNRIIAIKTSTPEGAPLVYPDETFDSPISNTVRLLDADQSDSFFFHSPSDHRCYMHCNVDSTRIVLKYNTEIQKLEPPNLGWSMGGMYVRSGVTFAVELTDDTIYQLGEGYQDAGIEFESIASISRIEGEDGRQTLLLESVGISGRASELATVVVEHYVGTNTTPQQKTFTTASGVSSGVLGSVTLGATTLGAGSGMELTEYDLLFGIFPRYGSSYQLAVRSTGAFTLSSYSVNGSALRKPLLVLQ